MNKQNMVLMCAAILMGSTAMAQQPTQPPVEQPSYSNNGEQDTYSYSLPDALDEKGPALKEEQSAAQKDDQQQRKLLIQNIRQLYHTQSNVLAP